MQNALKAQSNLFRLCSNHYNHHQEHLQYFYLKPSPSEGLDLFIYLFIYNKLTLIQKLF